MNSEEAHLDGYRSSYLHFVKEQDPSERTVSLGVMLVGRVSIRGRNCSVQIPDIRPPLCLLLRLSYVTVKGFGQCFKVGKITLSLVK